MPSKQNVISPPPPLKNRQKLATRDQQSVESAVRAVVIVGPQTTPEGPKAGVDPTSSKAASKQPMPPDPVELEAAKRKAKRKLKASKASKAGSRGAGNRTR